MSKGNQSTSFQYVPILKSKAGERWAISHLKPATRLAIRPLLEVHEHDTKSNADHLPSLCDDLASIWGDRPFYADGIWLHDEIGHAATIRLIDEAAHGCGMQAIQVARLGFSVASLAEMESIVDERKRGYLLRVTPAELGNTTRIDSVIAAIGVPRSDVDLLIDYRRQGMALAHDIPLVPHLGDWRSLIAASCAFPKSVASIPRFTWSTLPRNDWRTWRDGVAGALARKPIFADYTVKDCGAPAGGGDPPVSLKYTIDQDWLVRVDGSLQQGDAPKMYDICESLVHRSEFSGATFSEGDAEIFARAHPITADGPGAGQQWIQWSMNHHMEFVADQIGGASVTP